VKPASSHIGAKVLFSPDLGSFRMIGTLCAASTKCVKRTPISRRYPYFSNNKLIQESELSRPQRQIDVEEPNLSVDFSADVRNFIADVDEPVVPWLSRLELDEPRVNVKSLPTSYRVAKRTFDIVGALFLAVSLAPVWVTFPLVIKLTSGPGPVIFRQTRVGLNRRISVIERKISSANDSQVVSIGQSDRRTIFAYGKPFTLYKFRTMRNDAEKDGAQFTQANDSRVTKLGKFMRKTRIDEIPQLINVLRGDMSLVGPRPERPVFVDMLSKEIPCYLDRLGLRPGITGIAQIENGYDNDIESFRRKVVYDLQYLQHCSFRNDLKILFRTIHVIVTGKGAL